MVPAKTVQASFPSNLERTVASALLLLSSSSSSSSPESLESTGYSDSGGSCSSTAEACVGDEFAPTQELTVFAFVSGFDEMTLKIVRKKRSKTICISSGKKLKTSDSEPTSAPASSESVSGLTTLEASSCTTSSSSQSFSSETNSGDKPSKKPVMQGHIGHKAEAILRFLSNGGVSEVSIRQFLGDSPSTSKALRMLLKLHKVKRYGVGGRTNPFIYMIAD